MVAVATGPKHPTGHLFRNIVVPGVGNKEQTGLRGRAIRKTMWQYLKFCTIFFYDHAADMCRWRSDVIG